MVIYHNNIFLSSIYNNLFLYLPVTFNIFLLLFLYTWCDRKCAILCAGIWWFWSFFTLFLLKIIKIQWCFRWKSAKNSTKSSKKWLKWPLNANQMIKKHIIMMFKCYCEVFCWVLIPYYAISDPSIPGHRNRPIPGHRNWKLIRNKWNRLGAVCPPLWARIR